MGASATAEAQLSRDDRIIPATVAASSGSGRNCIENGGANVAPCDKSVSGNFGSFDAPRLNLYKPTSQVSNDSLRINYSMGVDHLLAIYGTGATKVCDYSQPVKSPCSTTNVASGKDANHLLPFTGNVVPPLTDGLVDNATISTDDGNNLFCGRLKRPDLTDDNLAVTDPEGCLHWTNSPGPGPSITVVGEKINGRHVAYWMKPEFRSIFYPATSPSTTPNTSSTWAAGDTMLNCFLEELPVRLRRHELQGACRTERFFINPAGVIDPNTATAPSSPS